MRRIGVVAVVVLLSAAAGGIWFQESKEKCEEQRQCHDCIQTPGCLWCNTATNKGDNCQHAASIKNIPDFCDEADLHNPENKIEVQRNEELTGAQEKAGRVARDNIIQLRPQQVKLSLRKDVPYRLDLTYQRARDYPLDLYYLMDLSNTMKDDRDELAKVGSILADTMTNLTTQFALGFGSFVDKVMLPFTSTSESCNTSTCNPPYSFRNDMSLSQDYTQFTKRVKDSQIASNVDFPEGGFDALMQAMVCEKEIGWRDVARRILVFSTDAKFHQAGDGRLAGVVTPNDGKCHLNAKGEYTDYDKYDYPSIGHINKVAKDKNINIIFAVLDHEKLYKELSEKYIETSSFGMLDKSSTNVVELIERQYYNISGGVTLTDNRDTDLIDIKYYSKCMGNHLIETKKCDDIKENDTVTFQLEITAKECPPDGKNSVVEVKTLEDKVILEIEFLCSCNCSDTGNTNASECQGRGSLVCGVCQCLDGFYGEECQCEVSGDSSGTSEDQNAECKASETDTEPCSGKGKCNCGTCECFDREVTGKFCQCDRRKCMGPKGECSGHGHCDCNECVCDQGYNGTLCRCPDKNCINPETLLVCSDHGECDCGRCKCRQQGSVIYTGQYCEDCPSCGKGKCGQFKDCVQCLHFGIGPLHPDCSNCKKSKLVDSLDDQVSKGARLCTIEDEQGCRVNFTYRYHEIDKKEEVFVQKERQCPEPAPIMSIVFSLIGAIVLIGVLTLIAWKILTTIHDRREYAKFVNESQNAQFGAEVNPLYVKATTTTQNPMFDGQEAT